MRENGDANRARVGLGAERFSRVGVLHCVTRCARVASLYCVTQCKQREGPGPL